LAAAGLIMAGSLLGIAQVTLADQPSPAPSSSFGATPVASPSASPSVLPLVRPGKVQNLSVVDNSLTVLTLGWQAPLVAGTEPIIDYLVKYKFDDFGSWLTWKHDPITVTTIQIPDLPLNRGIAFSVRAVTANTVSQAVSIHVLTPQPPQLLTTLSVQPELSYITSTWNSHASKKYGYYPGHDCANWASQALLKRGMVTTAKWHPRSSLSHGATKAWISSTSLHDYLLATGKFTLLTDAQRDQVRVGDIVQFDWWNTGAQEHTGIVSYIEPTSAGPKIYYASHTAHGLWWSVDRSIKVSYPGATVSYLHLN
jgi:hypothetical protein